MRLAFLIINQHPFTSNIFLFLLLILELLTNVWPFLSWFYSSTTSTPRKSRKRLRSVTPSDGSTGNLSDSDYLRSPLAKRKKIAADRSGSSKLKETFSAADVITQSDSDRSMSAIPIPEVEPAGASGSGVRSSAEGESGEGRSSKATTPRDGDGDEMDQDDDGEDGDTDGETEGGEIDDDDDFLARELGEDWG